MNKIDDPEEVINRLIKENNKTRLIIEDINTLIRFNAGHLDGLKTKSAIENLLKENHSLQNKIDNLYNEFKNVLKNLCNDDDTKEVKKYINNLLYNKKK